MSYRRVYTLVFLKHNNKILLGYKTRGFGVGKWNGFGGKVEPHETIIEGAKRELKEECNLTANLKHVGVLHYEVEDNPEIAIVHVFTSGVYFGKVSASEEMNPIEWFTYGGIPYGKMWPDCRYWYDLMLRDKYFSVYVRYGGDWNIAEKIIREYDNIEGAVSAVA